MEDARKLSDFIDLDLLQNIQDNCSKAMDLAFITVDYKGIPITKDVSYAAFYTSSKRAIALEHVKLSTFS